MNHLTGSLLELFKRLIGEGVLAPGDRLPPERKLAEMLGVSRSSLRPPLKVLETMGIISQRVGSGTHLNAAAASILAEPLQFLILLDGISFQELMEARLIVEPELAARAAERADDDDREALQRTIAEMEAAAGHPAEFVAWDLKFHQTLYRTAGNRVCTMLFTAVHQSLEELVRFTSEMVEPDHTIGLHRRILAAVREGDPELARLRMREHMEDASGLLTRGAAGRDRTARWMAARSPTFLGRLQTRD